MSFGRSSDFSRGSEYDPQPAEEDDASSEESSGFRPLASKGTLPSIRRDIQAPETPDNDDAYGHTKILAEPDAASIDQQTISGDEFGFTKILAEEGAGDEVQGLLKKSTEPLTDDDWGHTKVLSEAPPEAPPAKKPIFSPEPEPIPNPPAFTASPPPPQPGRLQSLDRDRKPPEATRGVHLPRSLTQVMQDANERVIQGDLIDYVPMPTGFDPLDGLIGGGLRKTELVLLGGAQGIGKTIATLQIARNLAMRPDHYAFYLSYEHTETHLMHRLLCLESVFPPEMNLSNGLKLRDLYQIIVSQRAKEMMGRDGGAGSLQKILGGSPKTSAALARMQQYSDRLILLKASPAVTNLRAIKEMVTKLCDATGGNVSLYVDYLQKVAVHPERPRDENDKVTIIVEGLKDIALTLDVPVWAIVAADREGLKSKRIHLFHLRGSSALDYESDIAIIMNNKYQILAKDHIAFNPYNAKQFRNWVVWTVEKNRAGRAMLDMEFELHGQHFAFDPRGQKVQQQLIDDKIIES